MLFIFLCCFRVVKAVVDRCIVVRVWVEELREARVVRELGHFVKIALVKTVCGVLDVFLLD